MLANLRAENLGERKDPLQLLLFSNIYEVNNALANWYANDRDRTILCMHNMLPESKLPSSPG